MAAPTNLELLLNNGIRDQNGFKIPSYSFEVPTILKARDGYDMVLGLNNPPSGTWIPYNAQFTYDFIGPSGGEYTLYAKVRNSALEESSVVSDSVFIWGTEKRIPLSINLDTSIYYQVKNILTAAGYVDISGVLNINVSQEDIESYIPVEVAEKIYDGEEYSAESLGLPVVLINNMNDKLSPGALGGANWETQYYNINIYGTSEYESKELSAVIREKLPYGIPVYDYSLGFPGISGFPLPNQFLGVFTTSDINSNKVMLPSYSVINNHRRVIKFNVKNMRKTY